MSWEVGANKASVLEGGITWHTCNKEMENTPVYCSNVQGVTDRNKANMSLADNFLQGLLGHCKFSGFLSEEIKKAFSQSILSNFRGKMVFKQKIS